MICYCYFCVVHTVPSEAMYIANLETRSKNRENHVSTKEKDLIPSDELGIADKLDGAKVWRRKRTRNRKIK